MGFNGHVIGWVWGVRGQEPSQLLPAYQHGGWFRPEDKERNRFLEEEHELSFGSTEFVVTPVEALAGKVQKDRGIGV